MNDFTTLTDAALSRIAESGNYWDRVHARDERYRRIEVSNRRGRDIGDLIDFVRFGTPVEFSTNYRDGLTEDGMSVYMLDGDEVLFVGFWMGISSRPAFRGRGRIVAWGSDCEPIVKVIGNCVRDIMFDRNSIHDQL